MFNLGHRCISGIMDYAQEERLQSNKQMTVRYTSRDGRSRFHGGSDLKQSQSYPAGSLSRFQQGFWMFLGWACFTISLMFFWWLDYIQLLPSTGFVPSFSLGLGLHLQNAEPATSRRMHGWPKSFSAGLSALLMRWIPGLGSMPCGKNMGAWIQFSLSYQNGRSSGS